VAEKSETGEELSPTASGLTERQQQILIFEKLLWKHPGAKEEAIRAQFGLSAARYYQLLNTVLDEPAALVFDPLLIRRLQRLRNARITARSMRAFGSHKPIDHQ
jgi:hypothetical protein